MMLKSIFDTMRKANVESVNDRYQRWLKEQEYECCSCGSYAKHDEIQEWIVSNEGEPEVVLVCPKCIRLGWDDWGR